MSATLHATSSEKTQGLDANAINTEPPITEATRIPYDAASARPSTTDPRTMIRMRQISSDTKRAVTIQASSKRGQKVCHRGCR